MIAVIEISTEWQDKSGEHIIRDHKVETEKI